MTDHTCVIIKDKLVFKDIPVRTKTFVASTNITVDKEKLFNAIETTPLDAEFAPGSVRKAKFGQTIKENNQSVIHTGRPFRNSMTIDIFVIDKFVNCKVTRNGVFQMTGCRSDEHAQKCVETIWKNYIRDSSFYTFTRGNCIEIMFVPHMSNIDFELGFRINRDRLNKCAIYLPEPDKNYLPQFEPMRHPAVNIKFPYEGDISMIDMTTMSIPDDEPIVFGHKHYKYYLDTQSLKKRNEKLSRKVSFLVFLSGKVIMSGGLCQKKSERAFYDFIQFVTKYRRYFELGRMSETFFRGSIAAASVINKKF